MPLSKEVLQPWALLSGSAPQTVKLKTKGEQNIKTELIICALAALTAINGTQAQSQGEGGYYQPNELNAYSINNITAKKSEGGSITIQFGGCDGTIPNCLPIMKGWNYMVRLYRPRAEILNGTWTFPEAHPVN